jgi:hypothetical protein
MRMDDVEFAECIQSVAELVDERFVFCLRTQLGRPGIDIARPDA